MLMKTRLYFLCPLLIFLFSSRGEGGFVVCVAVNGDTPRVGFPPPGIITRSSVWLGLPNFISGISVANGTDAWPEVFCVGSAVSNDALWQSFTVRLNAVNNNHVWLIQIIIHDPQEAWAEPTGVFSNSKRSKACVLILIRTWPLCLFCLFTDVDPVVFQCFFLVDLLLRCRRLPGCENICRNQVIRHLPRPIHYHLNISSYRAEAISRSVSERVKHFPLTYLYPAIDVTLLPHLKTPWNWFLSCRRESI